MFWMSNEKEADICFKGCGVTLGCMNVFWPWTFIVGIAIRRQAVFTVSYQMQDHVILLGFLKLIRFSWRYKELMY